MEEQRRKKLELPDPFADEWRFPQEGQSEHFHSGVDLFDIYTVLDVSPHFTQEHLRAAYKRKARELHPDKNPAPDATEKFQQFQSVYKQALSLFGGGDNKKQHGGFCD